MRVLILGCGPAGLIAAHAAMGAGAEVAIMSKKRKSFMKGAQYLHRPIPGISGEPFEVEYVLRGSPLQYRYKVYGRNWDGTVSPEDLDASHSAWDIREAYDKLWDAYEDYIQDWEATPGGLVHVLEKNRPDLVISSIPAPLLCSHGHTFRATQVFSTDEEGLPGLQVPDNTVICNGDESPRWYRAARIQGWLTVEWPNGAQPPVNPIWRVDKPLDNNCTCFPTVIRVGRYGQWNKGVLSHEAYDLTRMWIDEIRKELHQKADD